MVKWCKERTAIFQRAQAIEAHCVDRLPYCYEMVGAPGLKPRDTLIKSWLLYELEHFHYELAYPA